MRKFDKILLFFLSLIGLSLCVCLISFFYPVPYVHDYVHDMVRGSLLHYEYSWLYYVLVGFIATMGTGFLILLLIALCMPGRSNFLIIKKDKGELQFSRKAVESAVQYSFMHLKGIHASKIRVKLNKKPEKTKIYVKLFLTDHQLSVLAETVQEAILSSMQSSLGITAKSVMIKTIEYNPRGAVIRDDSSAAPIDTL